MDELSTRIHRLGSSVGKVSDRMADRSALADARRRWMAPAVPPRHRRATLWALAAALLALVSSSFVWLRIAPAAVSFEVGAPPVKGKVGDWVAAERDAPLDVRFSEGTQVTLVPGTRMRVTETTARGAHVLLERGALHATVQHTGPETRWSVRAGPFEVRVTGTSFDLGWDSESETFTLSMQRGSVIVRGPLLPPERTVVGGERLIVSIREGRMELTAASAPAAVQSPPVAEPDPGEPAAVLSSSSAPAAASLPPPPATTPSTSWKQLAAAGKYREAIDTAERGGFEAELERASASDLLALSDAARFAGRPARAREALLAQRRRFGARGRTAYLIAKIAADQQGNLAEAATWFETYLAEEPSGPLGEQALGRLMEIRQRTDAAAARALAERYLARYPNGAYAALARSLSSR